MQEGRGFARRKLNDLLWTLTVAVLALITLVAIFLGVFFTVVLGVFDAARTLDAALLEMAASFGAGRWRVFSTLVVPSALPFVGASLRLGVGQAT